MNTPGSSSLLATLYDLRKVQGSALVIGGLAVIHHGYLRGTEDVDALYAQHDEARILQALKTDFKATRKSKSGWHHLTHRKTGVRLELIPEGGLTTYGFIPGPAKVGGEDGFISLRGLIWLKLVAGRARDIGDLVTLATLRLKEFTAQRKKLPEELQPRFDEVVAQARKELAFDPSRPDAQPDKAQEQRQRYGVRKRRKKDQPRSGARI